MKVSTVSFLRSEEKILLFLPYRQKGTQTSEKEKTSIKPKKFLNEESNKIKLWQV
jgi:hypothetical protein